MRRGTALAGAVVAGLLLAGCGGNPAPKPLPKADSPSASSSPSISPSPTVPTLPADASTNTPAGAKSFLRYFVEVQNLAGNTGETMAVDALALDGCTGCRAISSLIKTTYGKGGRIEEGGWSVTRISPLPNPPKNLPFDYYDMVIRELPERLFRSADAQPRVFSGNPRSVIAMGLAYQSGRWKVARLIPQTEQ